MWHKDPWGEECFETYAECVHDAYWGNYDDIQDCSGEDYDECWDLFDIELDIELDDCEFMQDICLGFW